MAASSQFCCSCSTTSSTCSGVRPRSRTAPALSSIRLTAGCLGASGRQVPPNLNATCNVLHSASSSRLRMPMRLTKVYNQYIDSIMYSNFNLCEAPARCNSIILISSPSGPCLCNLTCHGPVSPVGA